MIAWQPTLKKTSLDNIEIYSSFDFNGFSEQSSEQLFEIVSSETTSDQNHIEDSSEDISGTLLSFDEKAELFIDSFLDRRESIEMIHHKGNLILVDLDALKSNGGQTHIMSWEFDDGSVVSTVGSRADYEMFGLIA